jgi:hypothetical protein
MERGGSLMGSDVVIQRDGSYLRLILPATESDWEGVWKVVEPEVAEGVAFAEIIAPSYYDEASLNGVRGLVDRLEDRGVDSIVGWEGIDRSLVASAS